jgi:hypothetical protein
VLGWVNSSILVGVFSFGIGILIPGVAAVMREVLKTEWRCGQSLAK